MLYGTDGGRSTKVMLVLASNTRTIMLMLASNTPHQLDWAVINRLDDIVKFQLPAVIQRQHLLVWYFKQQALKPATDGTRQLKIEDFNYITLCTKAAGLTEGMSAEAIEMVAIAWRKAAYTSIDLVFQEKMFLEVVEHRQKLARYRQ